MKNNKKMLLIIGLIVLIAFMANSVLAADEVVITTSLNNSFPRTTPINYGECFRINVTSAGSNSNAGSIDMINVTVFSTTDSQGIVVYLNETGANTGIFSTIVNVTGTQTMGPCINLSTTGSINGTNAGANYTINVTNSPHKVETINVTYNYSLSGSTSDSIVLQQTGVVYWLSGNTGVLNTGSTYTSETATSSLFGMGYNDSGENLDPAGVDQVILNVNVSNYSAANTVSVCLNESGVNTGIFTTQVQCGTGTGTAEDSLNYPINLRISGETSDANNALLVVEGDYLNISYADTNFNGAAQTLSDIIWIDTLGFLVAGATTTLDPDSSTYTTADLIKVYDNGTNQDYSAIDYNQRYVTLYSYDINWVLLTTLTIGMNESGANTGLFSTLNATVVANTSSSVTSATWASPSLVHIKAKEGGYINITYNDTANFSGIAPTTVIGPIKVDVYDKGALAFNYSGGAMGTADTFNISVNDSDINADPAAFEVLTVNVSSTSCPNGTMVGLNETGANTGLFSVINTTDGKINLLSTPGNCSVPGGAGGKYYLNVSAGDMIYITYTDVNPSATYRVTSKAEQTGNLNITTAIGQISTLSAFTTTSYVYANVTDHGRNTNNATIQCVEVTVNSTSDPAGITIGINESGANTGIFANLTLVDCTTLATMPLQLSTSSNDATNKLQVAEGDLVQFMYNDTKAADGTVPSTLSKTFNVQYTGAISIDKKRYHTLNDELVITVTDLDNRSGSASTVANITGIILSSSVNDTGITITLNESSANSGTFNAAIINTASANAVTIYLNTTDSNSSGPNVNLDVEAGGWVMANYTDRSDNTIKSTGKVRIANSSTTLAINDTHFKPVTGNSYKITINDCANNTNISLANVVDVYINSTANSTLQKLVGTETGANTCIFEANYTVTTATTAHTSTAIAVDSTNEEQFIFAYYDATLNSTGTNPTVYGAQTGLGVNPFDQLVGYYTAATAELDATSYNASSTVNFTVTDYDGNTDNDAANSVIVYFKSDVNSTVKEIGLTETGVNTGVFRNSSIYINTDPTYGPNYGAANITAMQGDTFKIWYQDTQKDGSTKNNLSDTGVVNMQVTIAGNGDQGDGWDLISVPLTLADTSVSSALRGVTYDTLYWYNATSSSWETPTTLAPLKAYWIKVNSTQTAYFTPITSNIDPTLSVPRLPPSMNLSNGWNLVGVNNLTDSISSGVLDTTLIDTSTGGTYTWRSLYDHTANGWTITTAPLAGTASAKIMAKGVGYWVYMSTNSATFRNYIGAAR